MASENNMGNRERLENDVEGDDDRDTQENVQRAPRRRKCKNRLIQLSEIFPGVTYQMVAVYGPEDDLSYIMAVEVDGKVYQGIGPSKMKAKIMAAEYALVELGCITEADMSTHLNTLDLIDSLAFDYTADIVSQSLLYYDFDKPYPEVDDSIMPWATEDTEALPVAIETESETVADESPSNLECEDDDDFRARLIGKNPLTIVGELQLDAHYALLAETGDQLHPLFAMCVTINGETFKGAGSSKKLAKARAARAALQKLFNFEFGTAENGMPIYEGDDEVWEQQKAKLEREAELLVQPGRNPVLLMKNYFPEAKYEHSNNADASNLYSARVTVADKTFTGVGTTKTDARTNAAANALEFVRSNGLLVAREQKVRSEWQEQSLRKKQLATKPSELKLLGAQKNAVAKLNVLYRGSVEFSDIAETAVRRTSLTAFTVAVRVEGQHYVGVGKTKKAARNAAAEKALRALDLWTEEDESAKWIATVEVDEDPVEAVRLMRERISEERMRHGWGTGTWGNGQGSSWGQGGWNESASSWGQDANWNDERGSWNNASWGFNGGASRERGIPVWEGSGQGRGDRGRSSFRGTRGGFSHDTNDEWKSEYAAHDADMRQGRFPHGRAIRGRAGHQSLLNRHPHQGGAAADRNDSFRSRPSALLPPPNHEAKSYFPKLSSLGNSQLIVPESCSWNFVLDRSTGVYRSANATESTSNVSGLLPPSDFSSGSGCATGANYSGMVDSSFGAGYQQAAAMGSGLASGGVADYSQQNASYGGNSTYVGSGFYGTSYDSFYGQNSYGFTGSF